MIKLFLFLIFILSVSPRDPVYHQQKVELYHSPGFDFFKSLDKKVKATVEGPYVEIQYTYTYKNQKDHLVKAEFKFPQAENDIFHRIEIQHENQDIVRLAFEEINAPGKQYDKKSETEELFLDKRVPVGNVRAYEIVNIIFTVLKPLKINFNQFYQLNLIAFDIFPDPHAFHHRYANIFRELGKKWNVQIELKSENPFAILANPIHNFQPALSNHTDRLSGTRVYKAFYNVTVHAFEYFIVYFARPDFHAPQTIMATHPFNPHDHAFMFSLIPDMNYFPDCGCKSRHCNSPPFHEEIQPILSNLSDRENLAKLKKATVQSDLHYFPNEYLFVIDRSDSMKGPQLENLKTTLNNFLDTLSKSTSFYSILSFGNSSQLHWKKPENDVPYKTPENTTEIMKWVETLEADMGKKDLLSALKFAFEEYEWTPLPKNVIILTGEEEEVSDMDEEESNMDEIIQLVQANSHTQKICALKMREKDEDIIQKIGEAGGCPIDLSWGAEYYFDMTLNIMDATLLSPKFNLAYEIRCIDEPGFVVHQEEGGYEGIPKEKAFIKWVNLNNIPNLKSCKAKIFYYSQHRCSSSYEEIEIFRSQKSELTDLWHKVASHAKLHDELQTEESKRRLMVNRVSEKDLASVLNQTQSPLNPFESQGTTQEELIHHDIPRSLYDVYQEQFNNLQCSDSKRPLLNSGYDPSDSQLRHNEDEEESLFLFKMTFIAGVCTLLSVAGLIM